MAQTVKPREIIVVDDASMDDTAEVASSFGDKIRYIRVDYRNSQLARNHGLSMADGEYVVFLDADDYLREDFLEKTQRIMQCDNKVLLVYSDRTNIGSRDLLAGVRQSTTWKTRDFNYDDLRKYNYISLTSLIRKNAFKGFDAKIRRLQDWEAWLNFLKPGSAVRIPEPLFHVRFHGNNKTFKENVNIERIKILFKHGILRTGSCDFRSAVTNKISSLKKAKNGIVLQRYPDDATDIVDYLEKMKKWKSGICICLINNRGENELKDSELNRYLSLNGWKYEIKNVNCPDGFMDVVKYNEHKSLRELDYVYMVTKASKMNEVLNKIPICGNEDMHCVSDIDLMDCVSLEQLDVLCFNRSGIRKYYGL